jgi:tRNA pseudouridine38-40 synthase
MASLYIVIVQPYAGDFRDVRQNRAVVRFCLLQRAALSLEFWCLCQHCRHYRHGPAMRNLKSVLAYDGTDYSGWQIQPGRSTIQGAVESALERILGHQVVVHASGRTDAGVHALNQVISFETTSPIPARNLLVALNQVLPPSIRFKQVIEAPAGFHARYHARRKTYRYHILQTPICSPFRARFVYHYPYLLDLDAIVQAASTLEGEHDFSSFAGADPGGKPTVPPSTAQPADNEVASREGTSISSRNNVRTIFRSRLLQKPHKLLSTYEVTGNGFLHHMVRNIVGTLIEIGRGKLPPDDTVRILAARDRRKAGPTAPPQGLFLAGVEY